jgi:SAM-dependent methyltransferase
MKVDRKQLEAEIKKFGPWTFLFDFGDGLFSIPREEWSSKFHNFIVQDYAARIVIPLIASNLDRPPSESTVLDIGCNDGWFCSMLAKIGFTRVVGIDPNKANIKRARIIKKAFRLENLELYCSSLDDYLTNEQFDVISMFGVLNHTNNPLNDLIKLHSLTKKYLYLDLDILCKDYVDTSFPPDFDSHIKDVSGQMRCHVELPHNDTSFKKDLVFQFSKRSVQMLLYRAGFFPVFQMLQPFSIPSHYRNDKRVFFMAKRSDRNLWKCEIELDFVREHVKCKLGNSLPELVDEGFKGFNIVRYLDAYFAIPQGLIERFDPITTIVSEKIYSCKEKSRLLTLLNIGEEDAIEINRAEKAEIAMTVCEELLLQSKYKETLTILDAIDTNRFGLNRKAATLMHIANQKSKFVNNRNERSCHLENSASFNKEQPAYSCHEIFNGYIGHKLNDND